MRGGVVARAVAQAHIDVDADMRPFRRGLKRAENIAQTGGGNLGQRFRNGFRHHLMGLGRDLTRTFSVDYSHVLERNSGRSFRRIRNMWGRTTHTMGTAFRSFTGNMQTGFRVAGKVAAGSLSMITSAWKNLDNQVRLIIGLIAVSAGQIAAILSALSSSAVSMASSIGMSLGAIIPLAGTAVSAALGISMMVAAMERMREQFPGINEGINSIKAAWDGWLDSFSAEAGEAIGRTLQAMAARMEQFDLGAPMGKSLAGVSDAFTRTLESPGFTAFMRSLRDHYPRAVENFGSGFARVFEAVSSLLAGAAPLAAELGRRFDRWAAGLARAAEEGRKSGAMKDVFRAVGDSVSAVWAVISSLGRAIGALFMATSGHGDSLMHRFSGLIDTFTKWVSSAKGQERINEWFETANSLLPALGDLLTGAGRAMAKLVTPETISLARNFLTTMGEWLPKLADVLTAVSNLDILGNLAHLFNTVSDAVAPLLPEISELTSLMGQTFKDAVDAVAPLLKNIAEAAKPVIDNFLDLASQIMPQVTDALGKISTALEPVISAFAHVVDFLQGILFPIFQVLIEGVIQGVVDAFEGFGRMVEGVVTFIGGLFSGDFAQMWQGLKDIALGALQLLWGVVQVWLIGRVVGIFRSLMTSATGIIRSLWTGARNLFNQGVQWVRNIATTGFNAVRNGISTAMTGARNIISNIWNAIRNAFTTSVNAVKNFAINGFNAVRTGINTALTAARTIVNNIWNWIKNFISTTVSNIRTTAVNAFNAVRNGIRTALNAARTIVNNVWNTIRSLIYVAVGAIRSRVISAFNAVRNGIRTALNAARNIVSNVFNAIRNIAVNVANSVRSGVTAAFNNVRSGVMNAVNGIRNSVTSGFNSVMNTVRNLPSRIWSALSKLWNDGISLGKNLIKGLINGIGSMAGTLWNAAQNIAKSAVNAIKGFFGIKSPSTVMRGFGHNIGEGLKLGLGDEEDEVSNSMKHLGEEALKGVDVRKYTNAGIMAAEAFANGLSSVDIGYLNAGVGDPSAISGVRRYPAGRTRDYAPTGDDSGRGGDTIIQEGAIQVQTPAQDGRIVAGQMLDELVKEL